MQEREDDSWLNPSRVASRERTALAVHRASLLRGEIASPADAPRGTFFHGFFLPFVLIVATVRDPVLRGPYVRLVAFRTAIVVVVAAIMAASGSLSSGNEHGPRKHGSGIVIHRSNTPSSSSSGGNRVDLPGLHLDLADPDNPKAEVLGQPVKVAVDAGGKSPDAAESKPPPTRFERFLAALQRAREWGLAFIALLSVLEIIVVFFSRRYDDWLSFHVARLAAVKPEDSAAGTPKIGVDFRWVYRKMKRRFRGYLVFFAGMPALLLLRIVPTLGTVVFSIGLTLWGWYWLGVFSAAKSAHAWADEDKASPPAPVRALLAGSGGRWLAPLRFYGHAWRWATKGMDPAVTTFERSPAPFLGLALARFVLSFPLFYFLARPVIPVAAGRLCAEADPEGRFTA